MRLLLTVVDPDSPVSCDVAVEAAEGTCLGQVRRELTRCVGRCDDPAVFLDGDEADDAWVLGRPPLLRGVLLAVGRAAAPTQGSGRTAHRTPGVLELHVLSGPDCGDIHRLPPGEHGIGRAAEATVRIDDHELSRLHATIRIGSDESPSRTVVRDLGSTNGTALDGVSVGPNGHPLTPGQVLRLGNTRLAMTEPSHRQRTWQPDGAGQLEVNRPPRVVPTLPTTTVVLPTPPVDPERTTFPWLAVLLPLVAGLGLVALTRQPTYLLLALLSPLAAAATHVNDRMSRRAGARTRQDTFVADTARAWTEIEEALDAAQRASAARHPGPSDLLLATTTAAASLWGRGAADADVLELRLGLGSVPSCVQVRTAPTAGRPDIDEQRHLSDAPVVLPLAEVGVLGLAGPRPRTLATARALVAQLVGWHSPVHLQLTVLAPDNGESWTWARWLPHADGPPVRIGVDAMTTASLVAQLTGLLEARARDDPFRRARREGGQGLEPFSVVVLDGAGALRRLPGVARLLTDGPAQGIVIVCLDEALVALPAECRSTVEVGPDGRARVRGLSTYDDVVVDGVSEQWCHRFARALAPLRDATPRQDDGLPDQVQLLDLLAAAGTDATDSRRLAELWQRTPRSTSAIMGVGPDRRPVAVDLAADGPHALVAGTTGAGKSELLQTLVASLAAANRPDEMSFVLIDYKGGAAFAACSRLPHTVGLVTDLDGHLTARALSSLGAELRRREHWLARAQCTNLETYVVRRQQQQQQATMPPLGRLVIVVDEFATLAEELPDFVGGLVGIAQRGRSLGVHLVLATQRPAGVVSAEIRANTGLRIALRVTDASDSTDVVDGPDAAGIDPARPGRAVLRCGPGPVRLLQTARIAVSSAAVGAGPPVPVVSRLDSLLVPAADADSSGRHAKPVDAGSYRNEPMTDLDRLVAAVSTAATLCAVPASPRPWLPPLPDVVTAAELAPPGTPTGGAAPLAMLDLPHEQRRDVLTFDATMPRHLLVAGGPRSGRSTLLRTLAAQVAQQCSSDQVHLYVIDGAGSLTGVEALPNVGARVGADELDRTARLLDWLVEDVARRRLTVVTDGRTDCGRGSSTLVLLIDAWDSLLAAYDDSEASRLLDQVSALLRDGATGGLSVVITGGRRLLTGPCAGLADRRWLLPLADTSDYVLAGIAARDVPRHRPPGRVLATPADVVDQSEPGAVVGVLEAQVCLLDPDPAPGAQGRALAMIAAQAGVGAATAAKVGTTMGLLTHPPHQILPLPDRVGLAETAGRARAGGRGPGFMLVGVGGDDLSPQGVDLATAGPAFLVAGPPGSGRSTALASMATWALEQGRPLVVVGSPGSPLRGVRHEQFLGVVDGADAQALAALVADHPDLAIAVDDAEDIHDAPVETVLLLAIRSSSRLNQNADQNANAAGGAPGPWLLLAGSTERLGACFRGITVEARRRRTGLLLGPAGPVEGDLFGLRLRRSTRLTPPGRGLLVDRGHATPVHVAMAARTQDRPRRLGWSA